MTITKQLSTLFIAFLSASNLWASALTKKSFKATVFNQSHYSFPELKLIVADNLGMRIESDINGVHLFSKKPDYDVVFLSPQAKLYYRFKYDDFIKQGSSGNWNIDANAWRANLVYKGIDKYKGLNCQYYFVPKNLSLIKQQIARKKPLDFQSEKVFSGKYITTVSKNDHDKKIASVVQKMYRFPSAPGLPVFFQGLSMRPKREFWMQADGDSSMYKKTFLETRSIKSELCSSDLFSIPGGYKETNDERKVIMSKETKEVLKNIFGGSNSSSKKRDR